MYFLTAYLIGPFNTKYLSVTPQLKHFYTLLLSFSSYLYRGRGKISRILNLSEIRIPKIISHTISTFKYGNTDSYYFKQNKRISLSYLIEQLHQTEWRESDEKI